MDHFLFLRINLCIIIGLVFNLNLRNPIDTTQPL